jgi:hypothetical protein
LLSVIRFTVAARSLAKSASQSSTHVGLGTGAVVVVAASVDDVTLPRRSCRQSLVAFDSLLPHAAAAH